MSAQWPYGGVNGDLSKRAYGIKTARRNISNLRCTDDTTLMAESREELKRLLMKVNKKSEKPGLKFKQRSCIQSHHFMAN